MVPDKGAEDRIVEHALPLTLLSFLFAQKLDLPEKLLLDTALHFYAVEIFLQGSIT